MRFNFHNWFSEVEVKGSTSIKRAYTKKPQLSLDQKLVCTKMEGYSKGAFPLDRKIDFTNKSKWKLKQTKKQKNNNNNKKKFL